MQESAVDGASNAKKGRAKWLCPNSLRGGTRLRLVRVVIFNRQQKLSVKEERSSSLRSQATPRYFNEVLNKWISLNLVDNERTRPSSVRERATLLYWLFHHQWMSEYGIT